MVAGTESNPGRVKIKIASQAFKIGFTSYKKYTIFNIFMQHVGSFSATFDIGNHANSAPPNHRYSGRACSSFTSFIDSQVWLAWGCGVGAKPISMCVTRVFYRDLDLFLALKLTLKHLWQHFFENFNFCPLKSSCRRPKYALSRPKNRFLISSSKWAKSEF